MLNVLVKANDEDGPVMCDSLRRRVFIKQLRWDCWFTVVTAPPQGGRHMSATNCTWTAAEVFGDKGGEVVSSWKDASRYEKTVTANQSHGTHTQVKVSWITFSHLQSGQNRRWSKGWRYSFIPLTRRQRCVLLWVSTGSMAREMVRKQMLNCLFWLFSWI